jgi:preprotein translocase subunit SecE
MILRVLAVMAGVVLPVRRWLGRPSRDSVSSTLAKESWTEAQEGRLAFPQGNHADHGHGVFAFVVVMALFLWLTDKSLEWLLYDLVLGMEKS